MNLKKAPTTADAALPSVLCIDSEERDRHTVETIIGQTCRVVHAASLAVGLRALTKQRFAIVLCDTDLPEGSWHRVLDTTLGCPEPPLLIVASRIADEALWAEALNLGAWDVLAKPYDVQEVTRIVSSACHQWRVRRGVTSLPSRSATEAKSMNTVTLAARTVCA